MGRAPVSSREPFPSMPQRMLQSFRGTPPGPFSITHKKQIGEIGSGVAFLRSRITPEDAGRTGASEPRSQNPIHWRPI